MYSALAAAALRERILLLLQLRTGICRLWHDLLLLLLRRRRLDWYCT